MIVITNQSYTYTGGNKLIVYNHISYTLQSSARQDTLCKYWCTV